MVAESKMYPRVKDLFEREGFEVLVDEFGVWPYEGGEARRMDIYAFRWHGDSVDVAAVECKPIPPPRGILSALPQAIDMMILVGESYIATPSGSLEGLNILDKLGIGYIAVGEGEAIKVKSPNPSKLDIRDEAGFVTQVRSRSKFLLAWTDYAGTRDFLRGALKDADMWVALDVKNGIQHNAWLFEGVFHSGLNLERKSLITEIVLNWSSKRTRGLLDELKRLPQGYSIRVWSIRSRPQQEKGPIMHKSVQDVGDKDVETLIDGMSRVCKDPQWKPHISVSRPLWSVTQDISRRDAAERLMEVRKEIEPLVDPLSPKSPQTRSAQGGQP